MKLQNVGVIQTLGFEFDCGAVSVSQYPDHPNDMKLTGVLVRLDEPSVKAPNGSQGHRILLPKAVAEKRIGTLVGMGLNYAPSLDKHNQRRKVGVIRRAWITGQDLHIEGTVWKHDFPEAERDLKQPGLGMSMELGEVHVADESANVWVLQDLCFLGATILDRDKAAYYKTRAIAAAAAGIERRLGMATTKKVVLSPGTKKLVELAATAAVTAVGDTLNPVLERQTKILAGLVARQDDFTSRLMGLEAKGKKDDGEEEDGDGTEMCGKCGKSHASTEACGMKAEKDGKEDGDDDDGDEDDMESAIDTGDLEDMGPETGDDEEDDDDPGHLSKGAANQGRKTTSEDKVGKTVATAQLKASMARERKLSAQVGTLTAQVNKLSKQIKAQGKQMAAAAEKQDRRSAGPMDQYVKMLLDKSGVNGKELQASGQKLSVTEVDAMINTAFPQGLSIVDRLRAKNLLLQAGMMEQGVVNRG